VSSARLAAALVAELSIAPRAYRAAHTQNTPDLCLNLRGMKTNARWRRRNRAESQREQLLQGQDMLFLLHQ
jgi:hypothetical protein